MRTPLGIDRQVPLFAALGCRVPEPPGRSLLTTRRGQQEGPAAACCHQVGNESGGIGPAAPHRNLTVGAIAYRRQAVLFLFFAR